MLVNEEGNDRKYSNEKGITLGQCQKISRQIQDELDMDDSFQQNYRLDVSSPGLDRALIYDWQFKKSVGQRLELILKSGERIIGALSAFNEQELEIQTDPKKPVQKLQRADIRQVNIKLQW